MEYTSYFYRIKTLQQQSGPSLIFLPGGPGIGSDYLQAFCNKLELKGSKYLIDFPQDGSNQFGTLDLKYWQDGLIDLVKNFKDPVLVTHSFAGMLTLSCPELEQNLKALILMNTTPSSSFFKHINEMQAQHALPDLMLAINKYNSSPSNAAYKEFWKTYQYYCFTQKEMDIAQAVINQFQVNHKSYDYICEKFYATYESKWYPKTLPTLIITSTEDYICPSDIFATHPNYQSKNITNKILKNAGHLPWLHHFDEIQKYFNNFIISLYPI